ncbi:hypothetical protein CR513_54449, partial [Mucuna pruriens]
MDHFLDRLNNERKMALKRVNSKNLANTKGHGPPGIKSEVWDGLVDTRVAFSSAYRGLGMHFGRRIKKIWQMLWHSLVGLAALIFEAQNAIHNLPLILSFVL